MQDLDDRAVIAHVEVAGGLALPPQQRELVAAIGLTDRRPERFLQPAPHHRRQNFTANHHDSGRDVMDALGYHVLRNPADHSGHAGQQLGTKLAQDGSDRVDRLQPIDQSVPLELEGTKRTADELSVIRIGSGAPARPRPCDLPAVCQGRGRHAAGAGIERSAPARYAGS